ncbi:MAG: bifunctional DNA-formamidopyrimidine glycosylase/DNA-(apurinic or apyrimidinic site) lyase [Dehalococcoidia bacterium]
MPELPEVETIRGDLAPLVAGRTVLAIAIDPATAHLLLGDVAPSAFLTETLGRTITSLGRRGKYLLAHLDNGRTWVIHLRMTGRLVWRPAGAPEEPYQRGAISLDGGHDLRWSDLRKFGTWRIVEDLDAYFAKRLGPEPIDGTFTLAQFRAALANRQAPVKSVLLDQRRVAGLGNIYVDEALYEARIRPDTLAGDVGPAAAKRLFEASRAVLERGIANRGASFKDYVDGQGNQGTQHMFVQVFRRTGKPCYACGAIIERVVIGGRSTHFCPACQPKARRKPARNEG